MIMIKQLLRQNGIILIFLLTRSKGINNFGGTEQQPAIMKNTIDGESKLYPLEGSLGEMGCSSQDVKTIIIQGK